MITKKKKQKSATIIVLTILTFALLLPLTVFAESSNEWIYEVNYTSGTTNEFSHQLSNDYDSSDETTDYYKVPHAYRFAEEDGVKMIRLYYQVSGGKNYGLVHIQYQDGSAVEGATVEDQKGRTARTANAYGLKPGTDYRFYWDASESNGKLSKNVAINFTTEGESAHTHVAAAAVKENEKAATCTEAGSYDEVVYCSECNAEISREKKTVDALGHDEKVSKEAKAATCTEDGWTEETKCSRCDEVIKESTAIKAKGHTDEVIQEKAATCTETGLTEGKKCSVCGETIKAQETVPAKGHTEEAIPAKEATCTETGLTEGTKCSVCGEIIKAQEEVPALGHKEAVIPGKDATCTETGLTEGLICDRCRETLKAQEEIPALGHDYKDGVCTRCGEKDPNYVEPVKLNGVVKGHDGKWGYYVDDVLQKDYTGIKKNDYGWWRIENGLVNFDAQGIYKNEYGWWKTTDGKVTFDETGIFQNEYGWWRVEDSKVNFKANGIYKNDYGWWKTTDGKVTFKENGIFKNEYGWWKVEKSKVNFKFTGIASNEYGTWYVKNGKVDFSKNGKVTYNGKTYNVTDGKAKLA